MKATAKPTILKSKSLKPELKKALKSALNPQSVMPIQESEINDFFNETDCRAYRIKYSDAAFRDVKSIIKTKVRNKSKVLAILNGNQNTTLDHLNSIWTSILNNVNDVYWGYYLGGKANNSLFLFVK